MHPGGRLHYHSDEIVRDLHPLPFYPFQSAGRFSRPANNERHLLFYIQFSIHCSTLHPKAQGAVCMFCRIFSAFLGVLTAAGAKSHTSVSYPAAWRHARSYRRFWPAAHPWQRRWPSWQQWAPARHRLWARNGWPRARFCILPVYNFKSLAVGMAVW